MATTRDRCPLPFLLPLLLLALPDPARGNEGGAAGSCQCRRVTAPPPFPEKLTSCDTCRDLTRFNFLRRRSVCGLNEEPWVSKLKNSHCKRGHLKEGAGKADASRGDRVPAPTSATTPSTPISRTSQTTVAAATSPRSTGVSSDKTQEMLWTTESHTETAWVPVMAGSTPEASAEAAAEEVNKAPLEEEEAVPLSSSATKTLGITILCAALLAGFAISVCWWRRRQRRFLQGGQRPQFPLGDEVEGALCLPGENT